MISENISIPAPHGMLQGVLAYPADRPPRFAVAMAGPHPLLGGDMNNNVLRGLESELLGHGAATLRFNYAGVGDSQGPSMLEIDQINDFLATSHLTNELDRRHDLSAAVAALTSIVGPSVPLLLVGYSFGCAVIAWWFDHCRNPLPPRCNRPSPTLPCHAVVCIAPTFGRHNYRGLARARVPKLVLASHNDFATSPEVLRRELNSWTAPTTLELAELDDHFFRGCEAWLAARIVPFFNTVMRSVQEPSAAADRRETETRKTA